jgi:uncharacterized membrane protein YciS (DUF1049 family)
VRLILILMTLMAISVSSFGAQKDKSTNFNFDELLIQGEYHFSDEMMITVEQDKVLDALLGVRKDFKDRMKRSASRY